MHKVIHWVVWALVVVGAINWGLYGLFNLDLVAWLFGAMTMGAKVVYLLIGLAGVYKLGMKLFMKKGRRK